LQWVGRKAFLRAIAFWLAALAIALSCPATAQVAILQIQVIEGDGAVHPPGSRSSRPLTVEITDETGKPVAGAAVTFHLPEDGPGGVFVNGLRTDVATTDAKGRASLHGLQVNRISGRFQIRIMVSKEQARAGTVCSQYITGTTSAAAQSAQAKSDADRTAVPQDSARPPAAAPVANGHGKRGAGKWIVAAAVVGGGTILGILAAGRLGSAAPAPSAGPALTIGPPSITVGKP
jgi:hypothetical protein